MKLVDRLLSHKYGFTTDMEVFVAYHCALHEFRQNKGTFGIQEIVDYVNKYVNSNLTITGDYGIMDRVRHVSEEADYTLPTNIENGFKYGGYTARQLVAIIEQYGGQFNEIELCSQCNRWFHSDLVKENDEGIRECVSCSDKYCNCHSCGERKSMYVVREAMGLSFCGSCYSKDIFRCDSCNEVGFVLDSSEDSAGQLICESCKEEHYTICEDCGELVRLDWLSDTDIEGFEYTCADCIISNYNTCSWCGDLKPVEEFGDNPEDSSICSECVEDCFNECSDCGSWYHTDYMDMDIGMCPSCISETMRECSMCGNHVSKSDVSRTSVNGVPGWYCNNCTEDIATCELCNELITEGCTTCGENNTVHEYDYKPSEYFYHGDNSRLLGIELEIELSTTHDEMVECVRGTGAKPTEIYFKKDGSLSHGIELVSHPATLDYHEKVIDWASLVGHIEAGGGEADNTDTCGIHVHLCKDGFGNDKYEQFQAIGNVAWFLEKHWDNVVKFSRRDSDRLERWAARLDLNADITSPSEVFDELVRRDSKYQAINNVNDDTVELRIFDGSLEYNTIMSALKFADLMFDVGKLQTEELYELTWSDFLKMGSDDEYWVEYVHEIFGSDIEIFD